MRVLVIEDDPSISRFLEKGLREAKFAVDVAANGIRGEQLARNEGYDVILLDLMLPQKNGLSILRSLRDRGQHVPVICLTAKDTVQDRVAGLGGSLLARRSLRPVTEMIAGAKRIDGDPSGNRIEVRGTGDELDQLAETLNIMLQRIERHVRQITNLPQTLLTNFAHRYRLCVAPRKSR